MENKNNTVPIRIMTPDDYQLDNVRMEKSKLILPGTYVVTKQGYVSAWEENRMNPKRKDYLEINGAGNVITGPDPLGRYYCFIGGVKAWIHGTSLIAKGR